MRIQHTTCSKIKNPLEKRNTNVSIMSSHPNASKWRASFNLVDKTVSTFNLPGSRAACEPEWSRRGPGKTQHGKRQDKYIRRKNKAQRKAEHIKGVGWSVVAYRSVHSNIDPLSTQSALLLWSVLYTPFITPLTLLSVSLLSVCLSVHGITRVFKNREGKEDKRRNAAFHPDFWQTD